MNDFIDPAVEQFARDHTDRSFLGGWFATGEHPVSWYQIAQAVFVLTLAPIAAWIWVSLGRRGRDRRFGVTSLGAKCEAAGKRRAHAEE